MLKWLKKLFYGTKDGLPQKKVSDEDFIDAGCLVIGGEYPITSMNKENLLI